MSDFVAFIWIALGVFASFLVPAAKKWVTPKQEDDDTLMNQLKPYLLAALGSLILGFVTLAAVRYTGGEITNWWEPFFFGYFFDSTIQKVST